MDLKEQFEKETGNDPWFEDDKTGLMGLTQDYVDWLESKLNNNEVLDLVSDRFSKKDAQNIINAWDWIPDGTHTVETAQVWVSQKLKPVIEGIRNKLNDH